MPHYQEDPDALSLLYVRSSKRQLVPLNAVAKLSRGRRAADGHPLGQLPAVTLSFNLTPGRSLGDAVAGPADRASHLAGHDQQRASRGPRRRSSRRSKAWACCSPWRILVIYIVLGILYESFIHPITILSGSAFGRVWGHCSPCCSSSRT